MKKLLRQIVVTATVICVSFGALALGVTHFSKAVPLAMSIKD